MTRKAAVAGRFYEGDREALERQVQSFIPEGLPKRKAWAVVSPHAGYPYSGRVAGETLAVIEMPHTFVLLGPNHRGIGEPAAVMASGSWQMPNGPVEINSPLARVVMAGSGLLREDEQAHLMEHSLEVQLPFIQVLAREFQIVPIVFKSLDLGACQNIGTSIARAVRWASPLSITLLASTDFTHYQPQKVAEEQDRLAIDRILALDAEGLYQTVQRHRISMCGVIPTVIALYACRQLGASRADLVRYMTSGDASGDYQQVVGYAGIIIT